MTTNRIPRGVYIVAALAALFSAPALAWTDAVGVEVLAIRATNANSDVSPELRPHLERLKRLGFTGFKLEKREAGKIEIGKALDATLIENNRVSVTPVKRDGRRIELRIALTKGDKTILNTSVTLNLGDSQMISGPKLANGDTLVIAVSGR